MPHPVLIYMNSGLPAHPSAIVAHIFPQPDIFLVSSLLLAVSFPEAMKKPLNYSRFDEQLEISYTLLRIEQAAGPATYYKHCWCVSGVVGQKAGEAKQKAIVIYSRVHVRNAMPFELGSNRFDNRCESWRSLCGFLRLNCHNLGKNFDWRKFRRELESASWRSVRFIIVRLHRHLTCTLCS